MSNITQINNESTTETKTETINDIISKPFYIRFPNDPAKIFWSRKLAPSAEEMMKKKTAVLGGLTDEMADDLIAEWEDAEKNYKEGDSSLAAITAVTRLIDQANARARDSYEVRRIMIVRELQGERSDRQIEAVRRRSGLSVEKLKQAITTGTVKEGTMAVSNGVPVDGIQQSTLDYLDGEIEKGKEAARHRKAKAEEAKGVSDASKSGDIDTEVA